MALFIMIFPIKGKKYHRRRIFWGLKRRRAPKIYAGSRRVGPSRSRIIFQKIIWQGLLGGLFVGIIWIIFFSPVFRIKEVNITGNESVSQEEINQTLKTVFEKRFFLIFSGDNIIFFNEEEAEKLLLEKNLYFENVKVKKIFPNLVKIEIKEKKAKLAWCQIIQKENPKNSENEMEEIEIDNSEDEDKISEQSQCFWVDEAGIAYSQTPPLKDLKMSLDSFKKEHILILKEKNKKLVKFVKLGTKVANPEFINSVLCVSETLSSAVDLKVVDFETPGAASRELHVTTSEGWKIYFDTSRNIKSQVDALANVLREKIKEKERENLEYVDLRVKDRVYYK